LNKAVRYSLWIGGSLLAALLLAWLLIVGYVLLNKETLLKKASMAINGQTRGQVHIGNAEISFFRNFPDLSFHLSDISVRDSLWQNHGHDLLQAEHLYARLPFFSLLSGHPKVNKVFLQKGSLYLFTDSTGYTNTYILRNNQPSKPGKAREMPAKFPDISLADMRFVLERQDRHKLFDLAVQRLDCTISNKDRSILAQVNVDIQVHNFCFNKEKGSFIKNRSLSGRFDIQFSTASHILQFSDITLRLDKHPFRFSGRFFPDVSSDPFFITIQTNDILFRQAASLMTPALQQKLNEYDIDRPVSLYAVLDAGAADDPQPQITVRMNASHVGLTTPVASFNDCSFTGNFTNEWVRGHKREDENSGLRFLSFSGNWEKIPLLADTIAITNLHLPFLSFDLHSTFDLSKLNEITNSNIRFGKGGCKLNISSYKGPLSKADSTIPSVYGSLDLDSASFSYLPYGFNLSDCQGRLRFKGQDLWIDHLETHTGASSIRVSGTVQNLLGLLAKSPEKLNMDLDVNSPRLNLADLAPLTGSRSVSKTLRKSKIPLGTLSGQVDRFLQDGAVNVKLEAADVRYKKFSGAHAKAFLSFRDNQITVSQMQVDQKSGSLTLRGNLNRMGDRTGSWLTMFSHLEQVDLPGIFAGFGNFGQTGLVDKNLKGKITADINLTGRLTDQSAIAPQSLKGTINFSIKDGQLLNFEPMRKIQEVAFKDRDFSDIRFAELKTKIHIDSTTLNFDRMEIQSTAFTLFVIGQYDFRSGPDMSIQVPFSTLRKKDESLPSKTGNNSKAGISIWLRARTGDDGKLKISWDPFKKALKKQHMPGKSGEKTRGG